MTTPPRIEPEELARLRFFESRAADSLDGAQEEFRAALEQHAPALLHAAEALPMLVAACRDGTTLAAQCKGEFAERVERTCRTALSDAGESPQEPAGYYENLPDKEHGPFGQHLAEHPKEPERE